MKRFLTPFGAGLSFSSGFHFARALLAIGAFASIGHAQTAGVVDSPFLDALREELRTNHPTLGAAQARLQAAKAGVRSVRLWEDPLVGLGVMAADNGMRRDDGDLIFSAEQALPRRKLYEARKARAAAETSILQAERQSAVLNLETLVAQTALELALADEVFAIGTNQVGWLKSMTVNARQRLVDPAANAAEPLRMESELAQEQQRLEASKRQRARFVRELNILLGRPIETEWPALRLPDQAVPTPPLTNGLSLFQVNPILNAQLKTAEAARADIEVARRERSPMFSVGAESRVYSGGHFRETTLGAKMSLPWFNGPVYGANVDRARQQQAAAEHEIEALERNLRKELVTVLTEAENAENLATTFAEHVIPLAEKASEATRNAWIGSKAVLFEVLESRRALLNARLEQRRAVAAQRGALERLRSIIPPASKP